MKPRNLQLALVLAGAALLGGSLTLTSLRRPASTRTAIGQPTLQSPERVADLVAPVADREGSEARISVDPPRRGPWTAPAGSAFLYDVRASLGMEVGTESAGGETAELSLEGKMRVMVLARREGEVLTGVMLPVVLLRGAKREDDEATGKAVESLEAQLREATLVRMTAAGDTLGYRFPSSMEADAKNWIRTLVSVSRFVVPEGHEATWETTETDTTGRFVARYQAVDAARIKKDKLRYLDALPAGKLSLLPEVTGHASGELDLERGWLVRSEVEETTALALSEAGLGMSIVMRAKLELAGQERCTPLADDSAWEGPWAALDGQGDAASVARAEHDEDVRLLDGASLEYLMAEIEDLLSRGKSDSYEIFVARQRLAALVRLRPETLSALRELLAQKRLDDTVAEVVLSAVGAAGTSASESFLLALVGDEQGQLAHRVGAVVALFQLQHCSAATFDAIHALALQSDGSTELGTSSLLLLGALASDAESASRVDRIAALLALKESTSDTSLWLRALGNCGGEEILDAVSPYLANGDPGLRLSAVEGLRDVPGERAVELLAQAAREDMDPSVRAAAAELLGKRWSDGGEEAVRHVVENDTERLVRSRALSGIALAAYDAPTAKDLLLRCAERDPDASVREHARELLAGMNT